MEFPIMQWLFAGVLKITGKNIFIIKLLNFAVGILTLVGVFRFLKLFFKNRNVALIGCWAFSFSPSFYYFIVSPIPDNFAMMCSIWGLVYFLIARSKETQRTYLCAGILLSLGTLAKLPFILYYAFILGYFVWIDNRYNFSTIKNYLCLTSPIMFPLIWYSMVINTWGGNPIVKGILRESSDLTIAAEYLIHHLISTLPELIINYGALLFFVIGIIYFFRKDLYKLSRAKVLYFWLGALLAYVVFEANVIGKSHDYYLFPFFLPVFLIVAFGYQQVVISKFRWVAFLSLAILPVTAYLRINDRWDIDRSSVYKDLEINKQLLTVAVPDNELCVVGSDDSHCIYFYYFNKKGWAFGEEGISKNQLKEYIAKGASYLYIDDEKYIENLLPFVDTLIVETNQFTVYKLN